MHGGSGECVSNPGKQIQDPTGPNGAKAKGCQIHSFNMSCVAQQTENTPRQTRQGSQPSR